MAKKPRPPLAQNRNARRRGPLVATLALLLVVGTIAAWWLVGRGPAPVALDTLKAVPTGDTVGLAPGDREHLTALRAEVARLRAAAPVDRAALAAAYGALGQAALAHELTTEAESALTNARDLAPRDAGWAYYLAYLYDRAHRPAEAAPLYEATAAVEPDNGAALVRLGETRHAAGQDDAARAALARALQVDPRLARAHYVLGQIAFDARDFATAAREWETVLTLQPTAAVVHRQLAATYGQLGDTARAQAHQALAGARVVEMVDDRVYALRTLQRSPRVLLMRGGDAMAAGRFDEAADLFGRAVNLESNDADAQANLGAALFQLGRSAEAETALRAAVRLDPRHGQAHYNLGALAWSAQRLDEAAAEFTAALAAPTPVADAHLGLGLLAQQRGDCTIAVPHLDAWLAGHPDDAAALAGRAACRATAPMRP
jgi:tetratricopeptide (TPR) repeat protein